MPPSPPRFNRPHAAQRTTARGFTLVEVLVATLLFAVGGLGIVAALGWAARLTSEGRLIEGQARAVQWAADSLRATACSGIAGGAANVFGSSATWSATALPQGMHVVIGSPPIARRSRTLGVELIIPCE